MLKAEQVPIEVMNEFQAALAHDESCAEAIAAAINAWPRMWHIEAVDFEHKIILPLPQEARDE